MQLTRRSADAGSGVFTGYSSLAVALALPTMEKFWLAM